MRRLGLRSRALGIALRAPHPRSSTGVQAYDLRLNGDERGKVGPFLDAGLKLIEFVVMTATQATLHPVPHHDDGAALRTIAGSDWDALHALLVETRDDGQSDAGYATFTTRRIAGW